MDFTFIEYNLIILTASFIIFSLAIKYEVNNKFLEFKKYILNNTKKLKKKIEDKKLLAQFDESLDLQFRVFNDSLNTVTSLVYHTFYGIFFFSIVGTFFSLLIELDIFNWKRFLPNFVVEYSLPTMAVILLYFTARGIFLLIAYTKIDNIEYSERIIKKYKQIFGGKIDKIFDEEDKYVPMGKLKINIITFLFILFFIVNRNFRNFFYKFYKL